MENLGETVQQLNVYQSRINSSTKSGTVDMEAHQKQASLLQDLVGAGIQLGKQIIYDLEEEKYKLTEDWKHLVGELTGQVQEDIQQTETSVAKDLPGLITTETTPSENKAE